MTCFDRRDFLKQATAVCVTGLGLTACERAAIASASDANGMRIGLVTYLWGKDMDLPTLIATCEESKVLGVELRTQHAHGVEPSLSKAQRREVRQRFEDSPVTLVGYGSNAQYHENDPARLKENIELTKQYVQLMHDCGGSGVKVKPNGFEKDVPREKTIEQIGKALNEVAAYGAEYGQKIRVEVHGRGTSELPVIKAIFDVADHSNVGVCWNSNHVDLEGKGLEHNFNLVKDRLADTVHVRELDRDDYPYERLMGLFKQVEYQGWILLEAHTNPSDKKAALIEQRHVFDRLLEG
ncbi:MAG: sugar phosphate isomerase/epimerase family protein [Pirellulaceae bacterium]